MTYRYGDTVRGEMGRRGVVLGKFVEMDRGYVVAQWGDNNYSSHLCEMLVRKASQEDIDNIERDSVELIMEDQMYESLGNMHEEYGRIADKVGDGSDYSRLPRAFRE